MTKQDLSRPTDAAAAARDEPAMLPAVDVIEDATGITLYADLPGVPKDRLNVRVEGETLLIDAEIVLPSPEGWRPATPRSSAHATAVPSR